MWSNISQPVPSHVYNTRRGLRPLCPSRRLPQNPKHLLVTLVCAQHFLPQTSSHRFSIPLPATLEKDCYSQQKHVLSCPSTSTVFNMGLCSTQDV